MFNSLKLGVYLRQGLQQPIRGGASLYSAPDWPSSACDARVVPADREEKPVRGESEQRPAEERRDSTGEKTEKTGAFGRLPSLTAR